MDAESYPTDLGHPVTAQSNCKRRMPRTTVPSTNTTWRHRLGFSLPTRRASDLSRSGMSCGTSWSKHGVKNTAPAGYSQTGTSRISLGLLSPSSSPPWHWQMLSLYKHLAQCSENRSKNQLHEVFQQTSAIRSRARRPGPRHCPRGRHCSAQAIRSRPRPCTQRGTRRATQESAASLGPGLLQSLWLWRCPSRTASAPRCAPGRRQSSR